MKKIIASITTFVLIGITLTIMLRRKRKESFACHFGEGDILIEDIVLNPVHILPESQWEADQEIDFYMKDKRNFYLLRIINSDESTLTLCDEAEIRYMIVCVPMNDTYPALEKIIHQLKEFPYAKKIKHKEETYRFVI